jgi:hypothetical protein
LTIRQWLFDFHQTVRLRKEQPPLLESSSCCAALYQDRMISKSDYNRLIQTVTASIRQGWVRIEDWRKWFSHSEKLRILCGNIVIG